MGGCVRVSQGKKITEKRKFDGECSVVFSMERHS